MDIDRSLRDPLSRRRLFQSAGVGLAGGSAVFLAACGGDDRKDVADANVETDRVDVEILNGALDLELMGIAAYKEGAGLLQGDVLQMVKGFLEQEGEHADALASAIRDADGEPNQAKSSYDFPRMRSQRDVLRFTVEIENTAVAAYIDALPKLTKGDLRTTAAAILTNDAQHLSVLRAELGLQPVPDAFVTGETPR